MAQSAERRTRIAEVVGSSPIRSTRPLVWGPARTVVRKLWRKIGDNADNLTNISNESRVVYGLRKWKAQACEESSENGNPNWNMLLENPNNEGNRIPTTVV